MRTAPIWGPGQCAFTLTLIGFEFQMRARREASRRVGACRFRISSGAKAGLQMTEWTFEERQVYPLSRAIRIAARSMHARGGGTRRATPPSSCIFCD
jgi:hypothetical protein